MSMTIIGLLLALSGWLMLRLSAANKDNAELRSRVDSLKRQLLRAR